MDPITSSAAGYNYSLALKAALSVFSTLNMYKYLNPPDACPTNNTEYDYIVVGGGTAGCVVASRLTEIKDISVGLIEAGCDFGIENIKPRLMRLNAESRLDWNFKSEPDINYGKCHLDSQCRHLAGKVLGGLSSVDMLLYSQGRESDYNAWSKITNDTSWSYEHVLKLFKKLENFDDGKFKNSPEATYHGFEGNVGLTKDTSPVLDSYYQAFNEMGINRIEDCYNRITRYGVTGATYFIQNYKRQNTGLSYLYPAKNRHNLDVIKNALVIKILFEGNKAVGVEAVDKNNNKFVLRAKREVIISAGTFNTVKILQQSGIGPKELLKSLQIKVISDLPVGENYQNHISTVLVAATRKTNCTLVPQNNNPGHYPLPTMISYSKVDNCEPHYKEYQAISSIVPVTPASPVLIYGAAFTRFNNDIMDNMYNRCKGREMMMTLIENTKVASRGTVKIRSTDYLDPPIIDAKYYSNQIDVDNMVKYVKDFRRIIETPSFKKVGAFFIDPEACNSFEEGSDDFYKCYVKCMMVPVPHACGTTALGSVVDGDMRVKGVEGLRVCGASIMTEPTAGSITVPTMMIGEMASEKIKKDYFKNKTNDSYLFYIDIITNT